VYFLFVCSLIGWQGGACGSAAAACRVKTQAVVAQTVAVAPVPLAVSVGVPVAEITPYYYSYSAYSNYSPQPAPSIDIDALATKLAAKLAANGNASNDPQPSPPHPSTPGKIGLQSLVAQKCAQCHSAAAPKGNVSLENPAALDCRTRLKAIRAVLSEKMPQGGPKLTPDEAGKVLEELVGQ
jgi:mono/diheme cytochrome c family protein